MMNFACYSISLVMSLALTCSIPSVAADRDDAWGLQFGESASEVNAAWGEPQHKSENTVEGQTWIYERPQHLRIYVIMKKERVLGATASLNLRPRPQQVVSTKVKWVDRLGVRLGESGTELFRQIGYGRTSTAGTLEMRLVNFHYRLGQLQYDYTVLAGFVNQESITETH